MKLILTVGILRICILNEVNLEKKCFSSRLLNKSSPVILSLLRTQVDFPKKLEYTFCLR